MLNPNGYSFLANCSEGVTLLRLVRSFHPDFIVVDTGLFTTELKSALETIDDEMLCACILFGDSSDTYISSLVEKSRAITACTRNAGRDILLLTVEMANMSFRRVSDLDRKLKDMTENFESRKMVEQAKRILMESEGMSENEAYERMRKKSMDNRMSMKAIAEAIIFTYDLTGKKEAKQKKENQK
jgi:response regulator NasT